MSGTAPKGDWREWYHSRPNDQFPYALPAVAAAIGVSEGYLRSFIRRQGGRFASSIYADNWCNAGLLNWLVGQGPQNLREPDYRSAACARWC